MLALHPKAIVILIGINALTGRQPASDTLANIRLMLEIKQTQQPLVPVVLCTVTDIELGFSLRTQNCG